MYPTCIGCGRGLGSNSIISTCRLGKRIAFDAERGRLWVICGHCDRWNLVPIEERWEAIEECQSLTNASSAAGEGAGVTAYRLSRNLTLFRVGTCDTIKLAQWRYAPLVRRRMRLHGLSEIIEQVSGRILALFGGSLGYAISGWSGLILGVLAIGIAYGLLSRLEGRRIVAFGRKDGTTPTPIRIRHLASTQIFADSEWPFFLVDVLSDDGPITLRGDRALFVAYLELVRAREDGTADDLRSALESLETFETSEDFIQHLTRRIARDHQRFAETERPEAQFDFSGILQRLPTRSRLGLEISLTDLIERSVSSSRLTALRSRWLEADELATIADDLLLPHWIGAWIKQHRRRPEEESGAAVEKGQPSP